MKAEKLGRIAYEAWFKHVFRRHTVIYPWQNLPSPIRESWIEIAEVVREAAE